MTENRTLGRAALAAVGALAVAAPAWGGTTELVSVNSKGVRGNGGGGAAAISGDGRFVAFTSSSTNLVPRDTNDAQDVFVRDRQAGATERVSVSSTGRQADGDSGIDGVAISGDGRFVAFSSDATDLAPGETGGGLFVRDRLKGTTERADVGPVASSREGLALSGDGRVVAFLVGTGGGFPPSFAVYVRDRVKRRTERVDVGPRGVAADEGSNDPALSADGRLVAFSSSATNLVRGDTNGRDDVFVRDRRTGTTELVSISSRGAQADGYSRLPAFSADGRFVAFESDATDLVPGDTNGSACADPGFCLDVFVRDQLKGTTERVSLGPHGAQANGDSQAPAISADGCFVAFTSDATDLVRGDTNGREDVFVRDRLKGTTERASVSSSGRQAAGSSSASALSADGRVVAFTSDADNLVPRDVHPPGGVFVRTR